MKNLTEISPSRRERLSETYVPYWRYNQECCQNRVLKIRNGKSACNNELTVKRCGSNRHNYKYYSVQGEFKCCGNKLVPKNDNIPC